MLVSPPHRLLEITDLCVNYDGIKALENIDLYIEQGEVVTLIGANGAGKTTTLRAISRLINPRHGQISYNGRLITPLSAYKVVKLGLAHCPEGRRILTKQTVLDNLELGAYVRSDFAGIRRDIGRAARSR